MAYLKLETEQYMKTAYKREAVAAKKIVSRKALRDFYTFLFGVLLIPVALRLPEWLPAIQESTILTPVIQYFS